MKSQYLERLTLFLIILFITVFILFLWNNYPDNSKESVEKKVRIRERLTACSAYTNYVDKAKNNKLLTRVFKSVISAAYRVEKSRIRSKNNADYAMMANRFIWAGNIVAPMYGFIIFTFVSSDSSKSRKKTFIMIISFLAVLNFINSAYDTHGRWGYSRVSHYYKESLIGQWVFRVNMNCLTKTDSELIEAVYS